ncbi:MAG: stage II sporulation protein M [Phycisphaerae bacterium]|nr:stage II sporulation protein M [Gemmatimonadaceae bacterium]
MPAQLSQTVDVETPELVVLTYTIAGVGSRALAALIDYSICIVSVIVGLVGLYQFGRWSGFGASKDATAAWILAALGLFQFAVLWLYYVLFEALADGQTPGKRIMRLRVVRDGGLAVNFEASAIRNLVRIVDMQPAFLYAVGLTSLVINSRGKRLGDLAAGTLVVKEALIPQALESRPVRESSVQPLSLSARLSENEYALLDRFVQRRMEFDTARRTALATGLVAQLRAALDPNADAAPVNALVRLHEDERSARARGVASRNDVGAARERHAIVAINSPRWRAFSNTLKELKGSGLKSLDENGVRKFVQEYRELSADLARLRTATRGTDSPELFFLNRLVANAHSLLYRRRSLSLAGVVQFLFADVPAEIRNSLRPIVLASLLLFVPIAIAARAIVVKPALISTMVSRGMIARADSGVVKSKSGKQDYIDDPQVLRPLLASRIMTNNVQVTFAAFAFGITAGIMTVWVLITNGISIGSVIGLYLTKDIGHLVFGFMAPHGVLGLTAIVIAAGAGFLLAAGMLIPGQRTRRQALVENARRAIRLIAGSTLLLVFAGVIEGFISPNASISLSAKYAFSAATAVALLTYLRPWARQPATMLRDSSAPDTDSPRSPSSLSAIHPAQ